MGSKNNYLFFDAEIDTVFANEDPFFDEVLHIFDKDWHGIRSASGTAPGHKLAISHATNLSSEDLRYIEGIISGYDIRRIVYQGFSPVAANLAYVLSRKPRAKYRQYVITHVNTAQFEHGFELEMLKTIHLQLHAGIVHRLGSVKPDFSHAIHFCRPETLFNYVPKIAAPAKAPVPDSGAEAFIPLENTFRKNFYTNVVAALRSERVAGVFCVNEPTLLDAVMPLGKLKRIPYQNKMGMLQIMSRVDVTMNVTFAECQPMTQLESLAVGTPCLTGPLEIEELRDHPLSRLCTVYACDNPRLLMEALDRLLAFLREAPETVSELITSYTATINTLADNAYKTFLEG